jgi:glycolate oxidase FAD binding subunit
VTMIRIEGFEASVAYRAARLQELLGTFGESTVETDPEKTAAGWAWVRDVAAFHDVPGDVWRISVKPSDGPGIGARAKAEGLLYDWGGGLVWARVPEGTDLRARLGAFDGHATLIRASEATRATIPSFQPDPGPLAALSEGLRRKFDPRGILDADCELHPLEQLTNSKTPRSSGPTRSCGPACIAGSAPRPARPTRCWATSSTARAGGST